jgi:hypothetical protein
MVFSFSDLRNIAEKDLKVKQNKKNGISEKVPPIPRLMPGPSFWKREEGGIFQLVKILPCPPFPKEGMKRQVRARMIFSELPE